MVRLGNELNSINYIRYLDKLKYEKIERLKKLNYKVISRSYHFYQKINFDIKDFNDTFYDLSENEKAIIMKLRIMNREKRTKIINEIFE